MSARLVLDNLLAYSLQIGMLVGLAAFIPALLRLRQPGARLAYWHILLAVCLLLPLQPWRQEVVAGAVSVTTTITALRPHSGPAHGFLPAFLSFTKAEFALLVLAGGFLIRLVWLGVGFWRLSRYRRRSCPLHPAPSWSVEASLQISPDVVSPVTFGWRRPVVLLPARFPSLEPTAQEAILCHEVLHVRRRDWLFMVAEELVRALFWFHPAIWWLLSEIGLAREQAVDREVIEITRQRDEYMDALLAIAGARHHLDLAPAPLFLRKRHLKQRVVSILKEHRTSTARLIAAFAAGLALLVGTCWLVAGAFPLMAAPQFVTDDPGITVDLQGATLLHRSSISYPPAALQQHVQGTLAVEVKLDTSGNVADARVLSGPDALRRAALESVLQWHFTRDSAATTRVLQIAFELLSDAAIPPAQPIPAVLPGVPQAAIKNAPSAVVPRTGGALAAVTMPILTAPGENVSVTAKPPQVQSMSSGSCTIKAVNISGLPEQVKNDLQNQLAPYVGSPCTGNSPDFARAVRDFDEHLLVRTRPVAGTADVELDVMAPAPPPTRIKVGPNVQAAMVVRKVQPMYPELAKSARVEGVVRLAVLIGKDGTIQELHSLGGPALLIQSAMDAVKQWLYRPTMLNGEPVTVETEIDVNFTLNQ
jgi:TonB family protein